MNLKEFVENLDKVSVLMEQEKYRDALSILDILKNVEMANNQDYNYTLIHQLYQLDSNCRSAFNQQIILEQIKNISIIKKSISFKDLSKVLKEKSELYISEEILRREIELLILRNLLNCQLKGNQLVFTSP